MGNARQDQKLGQLLVSAGLITSEQLARARHATFQKKAPLLEVLVSEGFAGREAIVGYLAQLYGFEVVELPPCLAIEKDVLNLLPHDECVKYSILPLSYSERVIKFALGDPVAALDVKDHLRGSFRQEIKLVVVSRERLEEAIERSYGEEIVIESIQVISGWTHDAADARKDTPGERGEGSKRKESDANSPSVKKLLNSLIVRALEKRASHIHLEAQDRFLRVRFRIDGVLLEQLSVPVAILPALASRIRHLTGLRGGEGRFGRSGKFYVRVEDREAKVCVNVSPTIAGERVVLQMVDQAQYPQDLDACGFGAEINKKLNSLLRARRGLITVCGPSCSGKTTTLYALIENLRREDLSIMTLEDSIEYPLEGAQQCELRQRPGTDYACGIENLLGQDVDVLAIGEISSKETARIAIEAALAGRLVIGTLRAPTAIDGVNKLKQLGLNRWQVSTALRAVLSQRLLRRVCRDCRQPADISDELVTRHGLQAEDCYQGYGCLSCNQMGFRGRVGVAELFEVDGVIRQVIARSDDASEIQAMGRERGIRSLWEQALQKVTKGQVSLEDVVETLENDSHWNSMVEVEAKCNSL